MNMSLPPAAGTRWFHGTEDHFEAFDPDLLNSQQGRGSPGFWFSNQEHAAGYYGANVVECELAIRNPLRVSSEEYYQARRGPSSWARLAQASGYDAVILEDVCDGDVPSTVTCVFSHERISVCGWRLWDDDRHCRVPVPSSRAPKPRR
jgi:hypothetical protein